jgi:hypothetical protein
VRKWFQNNCFQNATLHRYITAAGPFGVRRVLIDALGATEGDALRAALDAATAAVRTHAAAAAAAAAGAGAGKEASGGGGGGGGGWGGGGGGGGGGSSRWSGGPLGPAWAPVVWAAGAVAGAVGAVAGAAWRRK